MRHPAAIVTFVLASAGLPALAADPPPLAAPPPAAPRPPPPRKPPVKLALFCGVATALIPLGLGATHMANASTDAGKNVGLVVAGAGPALAPIASHVVLGEWKRAAFFGSLPLASEIGAAALVSAKPDAVFHGTIGSRTAFAILFSLDLFGAAVGMVDVVMASERSRPLPVTVAPVVGAGRYGFVVGGAL